MAQDLVRCGSSALPGRASNIKGGSRGEDARGRAAAGLPTAEVNAFRRASRGHPAAFRVSSARPVEIRSLDHEWDEEKDRGIELAPDRVGAPRALVAGPRRPGPIRRPGPVRCSPRTDPNRSGATQALTGTGRGTRSVRHKTRTLDVRNACDTRSSSPFGRLPESFNRGEQIMMRRRPGRHTSMRPTVDRLETRTLLSGAGATAGHWRATRMSHSSELGTVQPGQEMGPVNDQAHIGVSTANGENALPAHRVPGAASKEKGGRAGVGDAPRPEFPLLDRLAEFVPDPSNPDGGTWEPVTAGSVGAGNSTSSADNTYVIAHGWMPGYRNWADKQLNKGDAADLLGDLAGTEPCAEGRGAEHAVVVQGQQDGPEEGQLRDQRHRPGGVNPGGRPQSHRARL